MVECIPNFSEGRNAEAVRAIVDAIQSAAGVLLLGWESDADHNRSVVTFAGPAEAVMKAAVCGVGKAAELIDLSEHEGVHPRTGAADVIPFAPLEGSSVEECVRVAHQVGEQIWDRFGIPVYFYEAAALTTGRRRLEKVRRKEFDGMPPDVGAIVSHPTAGACVVGAREFLIAYNVLLDTPDLAVGQAIAKAIRESSGGFRYVKSIGLYLESRGRAQVSINLTKFAETPLDQVFECIQAEAKRLGASVEDCELIGFIPRRAFQMWPAFFERASNFDSSRIIENRIDRLLDSA
jgi:glutamate formiminotransferase